MKKRSAAKWLEDFLAWREKLSEFDKMNFDTLISLKNAEDIISRCPDGEYKDMATFALAVKDQLQKEEA